MTAWRSPLGGARPASRDGGDDVEEWDEERIQAAIEDRQRAEATATEPEDDGLRADGGPQEATADDVEAAMSDADPGLEEIVVGDHVRDRDAEDVPTMLVVGTPPERADEYDTGEGTVAESNPEYPADDDVLEVVFPDRTDVSTRPLTRYAYPRRRLQLETPVHEREVATDGGTATDTVTVSLEFDAPLSTDDLRERCEAIADRLEE